MTLDYESFPARLELLARISYNKQSWGWEAVKFIFAHRYETKARIYPKAVGARP